MKDEKHMFFSKASKVTCKYHNRRRALKETIRWKIANEVQEGWGRKK